MAAQTAMLDTAQHTAKATAAREAHHGEEGERCALLAGTTRTTNTMRVRLNTLHVHSRNMKPECTGRSVE